MSNNVQVQNSEQINIFSNVVIRFVTAAIILAITAFFTPGFTISSIWALALATVILTVIDFLLNRFTSLHTNAWSKGLVGFILAAATLYIIQYFVVGYSISWISAILGALIYGVVDFFIPEQETY